MKPDQMAQKSIAIAALTRGYEDKEKYQDLIARNQAINKHCSRQFENILFRRLLLLL